jgi:CBS domain-containing protein
MIQTAGDNTPAVTGSGVSFDTPMSRLMHPRPLTCGSDIAISQAVARMHERGVGSIVITDDGVTPQGIFTVHDLRRLVAGGTALGRPVSEAMTSEPWTLEADLPAFEGVLALAAHGIRHIVLVRDGCLVGVVSERDLFALKRIEVVELIRHIDRARSIEALADSRRGVMRLVDSLMAYGAAASHITRVLTLLNDHTVARAVELGLEEVGDPGVDFTWLAFGSEGRCEQTLLTDQDNGILFQPGDDGIEAGRERLLPVARRINEILAECGFSLCQGGIMASNPRLCLSYDEWRQRFDGLIRTNTPENLLQSSIYFDLRPVHGPQQPVMELRSAVWEQAAGSSLFRRMMAANALQQRPPVGLVRDFATQRDADGQRRLDLKRGGLTPFVDAARLLSLEGRITETNTQRRFAAVAEAGLVDADAAAAWSSSFSYLQLRRLQLHQEQARMGEVLSNRVNPRTLNSMDRRVLKEAFRQARELQKRLAVRYQL